MNKLILYTTDDGKSQIQLRTKRQTITSMGFWGENVGQIIVSNGFPLLSGAGTVSHARMEQKLGPLYLDFDQRRKAEEKAGRCAVHQCGRALCQGQAPEPAHG